MSFLFFFLSSSFDVALWVSQNSTSLIWKAPGIENPPPLTLKSSSNSSSSSSTSQTSALGTITTETNNGPSNLPGSGSQVRIEMLSNDPKALEERRKKKEEEKEKMRKQNVLASWHTESTVSGELTALGRKEEERRLMLEKIEKAGGGGGGVNGEEGKVEDGNEVEDCEY